MKKQKPLFYQNYYKIAEGRYSSYWLGKLINNFMFSGHKKTIMKNLDYTYLIIKLRYRRSPVVFILSALQKIRPLFKLKHVIIAGKRREFPSFLERSKQVNVSIKWIKELVMENKERLLYHRILAELIEIYRVKRHVLFKRRDEIFAEAVKNRFNLRYSF